MSGELLVPRDDLAPIMVPAGTVALDKNFRLVLDRGLVEAGKEWAVTPFCTCIATGGFDKSFVDRGDGKYVAACCHRPARAVYYFEGNDKMPTDFEGRVFAPDPPTHGEAPVPGHTRTETHLGPDYCLECSKKISDWVSWPCPPSLGEPSPTSTKCPGCDGYGMLDGAEPCPVCDPTGEKLQEELGVGTPSGIPFNPDAPQGFDGEGGGYRVTLTAQTTDGPRTLTSDPMTHGEATDSLAGVIAGVGEEYVLSAEILPPSAPAEHAVGDVVEVGGIAFEKIAEHPFPAPPPAPGPDTWTGWSEPLDPALEAELDAELAAEIAADSCGVCGHPGEHWVDGEPVPCPTGLTRAQAAAQRELAESVQREVTYPDVLAAHEADEAAARRAWELELCDSMEIPRGQCAHCLGQASPEVDAVVYGTPFAEPTAAVAQELAATFAQRRAAVQAVEAASFVQRATAQGTPVFADESGPEGYLPGDLVDVIAGPSPAAPAGATVGGPAPAVTSETKASMKFSNSELRKFKRCRRAWWLSYFRGLTPIREGVGPLSLGNMVHKPLELYYAMPDRDPAAFDWETPLAEYVEERLANPDLPEHLHADMLTDYELVKIMLRGYFDWLVEEGNDSEITVLAAEQEIEAFLDTISGTEVWLIGKLDAEIETKSDGRRGFIDHKSAANLTDLPKMGQKDEQFQHYGLLQRLHALAEGRTDARFANGGVWNILRKVKRTASAKPPFYGRVTVRHNDEVYRNFYARVWGEVRDILAVRAALEAGGSHHVEAYPNPTRDCSWDCPFVSICPQFDDGSDVEAVLAIDFTVHDPYARYTEIEKGGPTV